MYVHTIKITNVYSKHSILFFEQGNKQTNFIKIFYQKFKNIYIILLVSVPERKLCLKIKKKKKFEQCLLNFILKKLKKQHNFLHPLLLIDIVTFQKKFRLTRSQGFQFIFR